MPPAVFLFGTKPSFRPRKRTTLTSSSRDRVRSPTCTWSIPRGRIPILASENPARRISANCPLVTLSSPIRSAASSRTPETTPRTAAYSCARSSRASSLHFRLSSSSFSGSSKARRSCQSASAYRSKRSLPFFMTSAKGPNRCMKNARAFSASCLRALPPSLVCRSNAAAHILWPRIPAARR